MSEQPAEYHAATPPLLRPLNPQEHREMKQLNDALTQAKIELGDRHAELRMMRVGVEELTKRALKAEATLDETWKLVDAFRHKLDASEQKTGALNTRAEKAEARVAEQQAELAEQEVNKLRLIQETYNWSAAVKMLEAERVAKPDQEATCIFHGCKNGQVHDGACECYVNGRAHGEEAAQ